jgi:hypothetical protein
MSDRSFDLANEYASVRVQVDNDANGPRLKITDLSTSASVWLDPLELECLAWVRHEDLSYIVRPGYREELMEAAVQRSYRDELIEDLLRDPTSG